MNHSPTRPPSHKQAEDITQASIAMTEIPKEQASAIPFRYCEGKLEVCLITSRTGNGWGLPKGMINHGCTTEEAALLEASEEAGLEGEIYGRPVGEYTYLKSGSQHRVTVLLMKVSACRDHWLEQDMRSRQWTTPENARALVSNDRLRMLIDVGLTQVPSDQ